MNGVLLIDKPAGMTSRAVDNQFKRLLGRGARVGHAGTLDPFATGLLPVMLGEATKLSRYLTGGTKVYLAELRLGVKTATADAEGEVVATRAVPGVTDNAVREAMAELTGAITQTPPAFSAIKQGGVPLYKHARRGVAVEAAAREVMVYGWRLASLAPDSVTFEVTCGPGTYVRTLGEQLAERLGTVGHLTALRRLRAGGFDTTEAQPLAEALAAPRLVPLARAAGLPIVTLDAAQAQRARQGRALELSAAPAAGPVFAVDAGAVPVAVLTPAEDGWRVERGFALEKETAPGP